MPWKINIKKCNFKQSYLKSRTNLESRLRLSESPFNVWLKPLQPPALLPEAREDERVNKLIKRCN